MRPSSSVGVASRLASLISAARRRCGNLKFLDFVNYVRTLSGWPSRFPPATSRRRRIGCAAGSCSPPARRTGRLSASRLCSARPVVVSDGTLRRIVRVGDPLPSLDASVQLAALGRVLEPHQVSITDATDPTDPVLARFCDTALVLGFQPRIMGAFARMCPALSELHCNTVDFSWKDVSAEVDLATVVEQLGLDPGYVPGSPPPSALRQAAWFVALLQLSSSEGGSVLDSALASHVRRVPPPSPASGAVH